MSNARTAIVCVALFGSACASVRAEPLARLTPADPLFASRTMAGFDAFAAAQTPAMKAAQQVLATATLPTPSTRYGSGPIRVNDRYGERQRIADAALSLVGAQRIDVGGTAFPNDCSGFVRAVYASRGIDVYKTPRLTSTDNGVRVIHKFAEDRSGLHRRVFPRVGDIVFFHNTYDRNRNGNARDDSLTHTGVVERVDDDGTVHFVHRISGGIVRQRLNLLHPTLHAKNGKVLNDWLRRGGPNRLTGKLFASFGTVVR
jgi:cell wall-associated NlpC family hydrolase